MTLGVEHHLERAVGVIDDRALDCGPEGYTCRNRFLEGSNPDVDVETILPTLRLGDFLKRDDKSLFGIRDSRPRGVPDVWRHSEQGGPEGRELYSVTTIDDDLVDSPHWPRHAQTIEDRPGESRPPFAPVPVPVPDPVLP